jgi:hypothetical protein
MDRLQHVCLGIRVSVVNWKVYSTIAAWKQATRDFVPLAEIGMKLAAFGLVRLDGDARQHVFLDLFDWTRFNYNDILHIRC